MTWRILKYIHHLFYLRHRKGHGIHSPYLFEFVNKVLFNGAKLEVPGEILKVHRELKGDHSMIPAGDQGTTSQMDSAWERSVGSFVRRSSVTEKYGSLLFRITRWFGPEVVLELGTGLGISSLYLASGSTGVVLHTIEGNSVRASFAARLMRRCNPGQVVIHQGEMSDKIEEVIPYIRGRFVAFVDGNHLYEPTVFYVKKLIAMAGEESLIILDDIYWSKEMNKAWMEVISWQEVRLSIDLFQMGILLLRSDLNKVDLKIKF